MAGTGGGFGGIGPAGGGIPGSGSSGSGGFGGVGPTGAGIAGGGTPGGGVVGVGTPGSGISGGDAPGGVSGSGAFGGGTPGGGVVGVGTPGSGISGNAVRAVVFPVVVPSVTASPAVVFQAAACQVAVPSVAVFPAAAFPGALVPTAAVRLRVPLLCGRTGMSPAGPPEIRPRSSPRAIRTTGRRPRAWPCVPASGSDRWDAPPPKRDDDPDDKKSKKHSHIDKRERLTGDSARPARHRSHHPAHPPQLLPRPPRARPASRQRRGKVVPLSRQHRAGHRSLGHRPLGADGLLGMAGKGVYWRPILHVYVAPGAEQRFADLDRLLQGSGLIIQKKQ